MNFINPRNRPGLASVAVTCLVTASACTAPRPAPPQAGMPATPVAATATPSLPPPTPVPTMAEPPLTATPTPSAAPVPTSTPAPSPQPTAAATSSPTSIPTAPPVPTAAPTPATGTIDVVVRLLEDGKALPGNDSVAWLPSLRARPEDTVTAEIRQHDKQFDPRVSIVPVGSTVAFPNYDRVFHNVFSLSAPKSFDLGLYRNGKSRSETFNRPGLVQVFCNIHPQMEASLMVVDSRIVAVADPQGIAHLTGVPAGTVLVEVWNARAGRSSHEVEVPAGGRARLEVESDISDWRPTAHLNKHGEEYPPPDDDDFRY